MWARMVIQADTLSSHFLLESQVLPVGILPFLFRLETGPTLRESEKEILRN